MEEKEIKSILRAIYKQEEKNIKENEILRGLTRKIDHFYRQRLLASFSLFIVFLGGFIKLAQELIRFLNENNTLQFISLLFSDSSVVLKNINIYFLSLLEKTPLMYISYTLILFVLAFYSLLLTLNYSKNTKVKNIFS